MTNPAMVQVTTLKRKATEVIAELQKSKRPILVTEHGKPVAYLVDAVTYEQDQDRIETLLAIAEGEADIAAGRVKTQEEIEKDMRKFMVDLRKKSYVA
jgi:prevent-host-death family protein